MNLLQSGFETKVDFTFKDFIPETSPQFLHGKGACENSVLPQPK